MPRTPLQYQEIKDERVISIFTAALPLFAIKGKGNVSVDEISNAAKCSHGLVYHYFKNTDVLYKNLLESDTFQVFNNDLFVITYENPNEQIKNTIKTLLNVSIKNQNKIYYYLLLLKDEDKKLFNYFLSLTSNVEAVETLFVLLKGIYLPLVTEKHPSNKVPSFESVIKLFY